MKRKLAAVALALAAALGLTACEDGTKTTPQGHNPERMEVVAVPLTNGRTVECVYLGFGFGNASSGGPSCDWNNAR